MGKSSSRFTSSRLTVPAGGGLNNSSNMHLMSYTIDGYFGGTSGDIVSQGLQYGRQGVMLNGGISPFVIDTNDKFD